MLSLAIAFSALVMHASASSNGHDSLDMKCSEGFFPLYYAPTMQFAVEPARFLTETGSFFHSKWAVSINSYGFFMLLVR